MVEDFYSYRITNATFQKINKDKTVSPATQFGCLGKLDAETEIKEVIRKSEGITVQSRGVPQHIMITLSAHIQIAILRDIFGFHTNGLKKGVWAYGKNGLPANFIFTGDVYDLFETDRKLIAHPNCSANTGFKWSLENGSDEVAEIEMEIKAMADESGEMMYEVFASEIEDDSIIAQWHTAFNRELVEAAASGGEG